MVDAGHPDDDRHPGDVGAGHVPVMVGPVLGLFEPAVAHRDAVLVDATVGRAGHAGALLDAHPGLSLIAVDADATAVARSRALLARHADRVRVTQARYDRIREVVVATGRRRVQGVLFDLGVSSPQIDEPGRGFSYAVDAPLDMRMDVSSPVTAADVVNGYSAHDLSRVLRGYGEERFARRIADAVVRERSRAPVTTTGRLAEIVQASIPAAARRRGGHPAKRTFQALRIEVNGELAALERALPAAVDLLSVGGRVVVLAYHSLEDRIVKRAFAARSAGSTPVGLPVELPNSGPELRMLTRGALRPTGDEVARNPRSASARLRAAERLRPAAPGKGDP